MNWSSRFKSSSLVKVKVCWKMSPHFKSWLALFCIWKRKKKHF